MEKIGYYFGDVLDFEDLRASFDAAEKAVGDHRFDFHSPGVAYGAQVTANAFFANAFKVSPGVVIGKSGERINIRNDGTPEDTGGRIDPDSAGASTDPGPGNYRWVTVCARFGRTMGNPKTDDLSNVIFTSITDSWNANGVDFFDDATQPANQLSDGGYESDNFGLSLDGFFVVAGPAVPIGNSLTFAALPADAVILADILYTDGDQGNVLDDAAISYDRQALSMPLFTPAPFPYAVHDMPRRLIWQIDGQQNSTRFYISENGLEIVANAHWNQSTALWTADNTGTSASKLSILAQGWIFEMKNSSGTATPWTDQPQSTSGWDSWYRLQAASLSEIGFADMDGSSSGNGIQSGYISWGGTVTGSFANPIGYAAIQFPRTFNSTPSSVTLGSAGPSETNISAVATGHLGTHGADFLVSATTTGKTVAQRTYTATQ